MDYTQDEVRAGSRAGQAFKRLVLTLVVLGLLGAVAFLLSQLNARTFSVGMQDGQLVVMKGRMLPIGSEPYRPIDPVLAQTYAPIDVGGMVPTPLLGQKFNERDELDRAVFSVLESLARPRVTADNPEELEKGLYFLERAERLSGISADQRGSLKGMRAEVAFYQARMKMDQARRLLEDALGELKLAAGSNTRHARSANQMISTVEPPTHVLADALRRAVYTLSEPPPQPIQVPQPAVPAPVAVPAPAAPQPPLAQEAPPSPPAPAPTPAAEANAAEPSKLKASRAKDTGTLLLTTETGADVLIDGKAMGKTPDVGTITLPTGSHQLEVRVGDRFFKKLVVIRPGEATKVTAELD